MMQTNREEKSIHTFYMLPKALFQPPHNTLSLHAKMLYMLMLDRFRLSKKNNRIDANGRIYIYYTVKEITAQLSCSHTFAVKLLSELETHMGTGLIERRKQGQGKPSIIYVNPIDDISDFHTKDFSDSEVFEEEFRNSTPDTFGLQSCLCQEVNEMECNNNDKNNNKENNNDSVISDHIISEKDAIEMIEKNNFIKNIVKENISYETAVYDFGESWTNGIVELITDVVCSDSEFIRINKQDYPKELVAERFLELRHNHIQNVYMTMREITTPPVNVRSYMITALYRAYETAEYWINAKAYSDIAREKKYA